MKRKKVSFYNSIKSINSISKRNPPPDFRFSIDLTPNEYSFEYRKCDLIKSNIDRYFDKL